MTSKDFVNINLMLITSVILFITYDGEISVLVNSDRKDNNITWLVIVVSCYDRTFTLEVPFIPIINLFTTKFESFGKFLLLTVLYLLHTLIDGEVIELSMTDKVQQCTIRMPDAIFKELHPHEIDGCCHP